MLFRILCTASYAEQGADLALRSLSGACCSLRPSATLPPREWTPAGAPVPWHGRPAASAIQHMKYKPSERHKGVQRVCDASFHFRTQGRLSSDTQGRCSNGITSTIQQNTRTCILKWLGWINRAASSFRQYQYSYVHTCFCVAIITLHDISVWPPQYGRDLSLARRRIHAAPRDLDDLPAFVSNIIWRKGAPIYPIE